MNEYALADAFHVVGDHLYGAEWTGNEILGRRAENPQPILDARKPLEDLREELNQLISQKKRDYRQVVVKVEIHKIKHEISKLETQRDQVAAQLLDIGEVRDSEVGDYKLWERFETVEGYLLRALMGEAFSVSRPFCLDVPARLWRELPTSFDFDFERSLIFMPTNESSKKMQTGRIKKDEFHEWLDTVVPLVDSEIEKLDDEIKAAIALKKIMEKDDNLRRDDYKKILLLEIPNLSGHAFRRVWEKNAPPEKKLRGRRKAKES